MGHIFSLAKMFAFVAANKLRGTPKYLLGIQKENLCLNQ